MTDNNPPEQRQFSRIPFDAVAHLHHLAHAIHVNCAVIDISLQGILINKPDNWQGHLAEQYHIDLLLDQAEVVIKMIASVAHIDQTRIGFLCEHIDLESLTHLKRLVELNLGDDALLHREFSALLHA
jgi:hypothetical protein